MSKHVRTAVGSVALVLFAALGPLLLTSSSSAAELGITIQEYEFLPKNPQVKPATKVVWTNHGQVGHRVVFDGGQSESFDSGYLGPDATATYTFNNLGTFVYHCAIHPQVMSGTVKVTNNPTTPPPSPTGTITHTITQSPTPKKTKTSTSSPSPTQSASPTVTPTPTPTPTPTFTETPEPTASGIGAPEPTVPTGSGGSGNAQAIGAIVGVIVLGALGFLVYRRTVGRPPSPPPPPDMEP